jgi:hypothetical protein
MESVLEEGEYVVGTWWGIMMPWLSKKSGLNSQGHTHKISGTTDHKYDTGKQTKQRSSASSIFGYWYCSHSPGLRRPNRAPLPT